MRGWARGLSLWLLLFLVACDSGQESPKRAAPTLTPTATLTATAEPPTATPDPNFTPSPTACVPNAEWQDTYTIQLGDTLGAIAIASGTTIKALQDANCLTDRNLLVVGQVLRVPNAFSIDIAASETGIEGVIVFVRDDGPGQRDLWSVKVDGSVLRQISESGWVMGKPARSSNLLSVAYRVVSPFHIPDAPPVSLNDLPSNIWVVNADGTFPLRLVDQGPADALLRSDAVWSPDGERLAFVEQGLLSGSLVVIQRDGARRFVVATGNFRPADQPPPPPSWSPDGLTLAYLTWDERNRATLHTIGADGLNERQASGGFSYGGGPYWVPLQGDVGSPSIAFAIQEPDGKLSWHVVDLADGVIYPRPGGLALLDATLGWTLRVDGSELVVYTPDGSVQATLDAPMDALSWSPSGAKIVLAKAGGGLALVDLQQGGERRTTEGNDLLPAWTPSVWLVLP